MKRVIGIYSAPRQHWVGDGFPVRSLFSYQTMAAPGPSCCWTGLARHIRARRSCQGRGEHPHRGFETVTIVYEGRLPIATRPARGIIGPGDVQWMTAAAGIMHDEFHSQGLPVVWHPRYGAAVGQPARQTQDVDARLSGHHQRHHPATEPQGGRCAVRIIAGNDAGLQQKAR